MAYIGKKPEDAFRGLAYYDTFTGDGSTTTFDLSADAPDGGQNDITVVVDNVRQEPGASKSYTLGVDGSGRYRRITFNTAPSNGSEIYAINPGRSTQLNTVSDNAITTAKIFADAVTGAKIADDSIDSEHIVDGSVDNVHLANSSITINGNAVSLGGSITAGTDWQAVTVADGSTQLNAVAGKGYFLDTNAGTIDVNLPTSPTRGDTIVIADYGNNFAQNRVIINTGGKLIDSVVGGEPGSSGFTIETNGAVVELVFADDTAGWIIKQNNAPSDLGAEVYAAFIEATGGTVSTSGNFKIHTFTGDGCFVVSSVGNPAGSTTVDYLVVAGGGGGGQTAEGGAGGGGAGGFRMSNSTCMPAPLTSPLASPSGLAVTAQTYPVTVGAGGTGGTNGRHPAGKVDGTNGSNSIFSTITSAGGGFGGGGDFPYPGTSATPGNPGGSGGGGHGNTVGAGGTGVGTGNTPPVSPSQGNNGGLGTASDSDGSAQNGGGGGGAGAVGSQASPTSPGGSPYTGGAGGIGGFVVSAGFAGCNGTTGPVCGARYFSGGGGGGRRGSAPNGTAGVGGSGGGGDGTLGDSASNGVTGTANTGGGGGGAGRSEIGPTSPAGGNGGAGGKGIVVIRYKFQ